MWLNAYNNRWDIVSSHLWIGAWHGLMDAWLYLDPMLLLDGCMAFETQ